MRGITQNLKLEAEFGGILSEPWGNERAGFTVSGKLNLKWWRLERKSAP